MRSLCHKLMEHNKILIVDDDEQVAQRIQRILVNNGFHVVNITIEKDPVNNTVNGIFKARLRLNE